MKKYEINDKTIALYPMFSKTRVYEESSSFIIDMPTQEIMEQNCKYYGSSLEGRKQGTKNLIGISYKAPIIVEESNDIIFFPTSSPKRGNCTWIRANKIKSMYYRNHRLVVEFKNGDKIMLNSSYDIINNQILRSSLLESILRTRKLQK